MLRKIRRASKITRLSLLTLFSLAVALGVVNAERFASGSFVTRATEYPNVGVTNYRSLTNAGVVSSALIPDAQLFVEEFSYATGQLTDVNGGANVSGGNWVTFSGTTNPLMVSSGSLSYTGYASSGIGNKVDMVNGSAEDAYRGFSSQAVGTTTYAAFLVNVASTTGMQPNTSTTGDYFAGFLPSDSTTDLDTRVSLRQGTTAGTFQLGLRATSANTSSTFSNVDLSLGTTYLVVISYQLVAGNSNDVTNLWVNPAVGGTEPAPTVTQTTATTTDNTNVSRFFLRQGTNAVNASVDGIRVGTTWADVATVATTCNTTTPLTGSQEVPASGSTATGTGTTSLSVDETTLFVNLSFSGLGSNASDAHIHGPAGIGTEAGVVFGLTGVPAATSGSIPAQSFALTPTQLQQYKQGLLYFNVHSVNFPGGEIRGQIFPVCGSPVVQFGTPTFSVNESGSAAITVTRTGDTSGTSTVTFSTVAGGTAAGGTCPSGDYATTSQTVTFTAGDTSETVNVPICADVSAESTETVNLALTGPSAGTSVGVQSTAVLSISDAATQYRNTAPITVNGGSVADLYPSTINVVGAPTSVFRIRVTLFNFLATPGNHVDVLLVSPSGAKYLLLGHVGTSTPQTTPVTLTFLDTAAAVLPNSSPLTSGTFRPTNCDVIDPFPAPAPAGPYVDPGCDLDRSLSETLFGTFSLQNGNGLWSLYVREEDAFSTTPVGAFLGGWGIEFLGSTAADGMVSGRVVTSDGNGLRGARVTMVDSRGVVRVVTTSSLGYYQFDEVETGETYIIGVSSKRFRFASRSLQVVDSLTDVDFVGIE